MAAKGQHIIAEPPDFSALLGGGAQTLGGAVAANLSGPRRVAWGAMRDHVMGVRAVNGIGETIHSGGRVLKNVTGLDLCKLLAGSHGTLAVLSEITLKVLPAPERRATLVLRGLAPERAVAALAAALGSPYAVSGAAHLPAAQAARVPALAWLGGAVTLARIEDFASSVAYRSGRLRADLAAFGGLGGGARRAATGCGGGGRVARVGAALRRAGGGPRGGRGVRCRVVFRLGRRAGLGGGAGHRGGA